MSKTFSPFKAQPPRPPSIALDRFGHMIEVGHIVLFHHGEDLAFEVVDVRPVLNPGAPAQTIQIMLKAEFPVQTLAAMPNRGFVIVGESQARLAAKAADNGKPERVPSITLTDSEMPGVSGDRPAADAEVGQGDAGEGPAPASEVTQGACDACGDVGPLGAACVECGCGAYQAPTLGDA